MKEVLELVAGFFLLLFVIACWAVPLVLATLVVTAVLRCTHVIH